MIFNTSATNRNSYSFFFNKFSPQVIFQWHVAARNMIMFEVTTRQIK